MSTDVEICSMALSRLGQGAITSLADTDNVSVTCNVHFQQAVDWVLREREWKNAIKRAALATPDGTPVFGWTENYNVPADCLRVLDVRANNLEDYTENNTRWNHEDGVINCEIDDGIKIKYIYRVAAASIESHIVAVIALKLADMICITITNSKKLKEGISMEYKDVLRDAAALDGMQGKNRILRSNRLTKVRMQNQSLATKYV